MQYAAPRIATFAACLLLSQLAAGADEEPPLKLPRGPLPWEEPGATRVPGPAQISPREALNIDDAELAKLVDGRPLAADEMPALFRILFRMPLFAPESVAGWAKPLEAVEAIAGKPDEHRLMFFSLEGRVTGAEQHDLPPELAEVLEFRQYYLVTLQLDDESPPVTVFARRVPRSWLAAKSLDEPAKVQGLFLKVAADDGEARLLFAADRIHWYPARANESLGVAQDHVYLAELGVDIGQFDNIIDLTNRDSITPRERDIFYQLLYTVDRTDRKKLAGHQSAFDLVALLKRADTLRGRVIDVEGNARQVMRIEVKDQDIQKRFGIDHYYQIDIFVPLEIKVRMTDPADSEKSIEYDRYPVTVCLRHLPPELTEPGKPNVYQSINRQVRVPAVFFKDWAVTTEQMQRIGTDQKQAIPMFVARDVEVISTERAANPWVSVAIGLAFVGVLGAIWIAVWRSMRGDKKFESEKLKRRFEVQDGKSLDEQGIEAQDGPDFSSLK